jgi:hypothetical protein
VSKRFCVLFTSGPSLTQSKAQEMSAIQSRIIQRSLDRTLEFGQAFCHCCWAIEGEGLQLAQDTFPEGISSHAEHANKWETVQAY